VPVIDDDHVHPEVFTGVFPWIDRQSPANPVLD